MITKINTRKNESLIGEGVKEYEVIMYLKVNGERAVEYHTYRGEPDRVEAIKFLNFLEQHYCHKDIPIELVAFEIVCVEETVLDREILQSNLGK